MRFFYSLYVTSFEPSRHLTDVVGPCPSRTVVANSTGAKSKSLLFLGRKATSGATMWWYVMVVAEHNASPFFPCSWWVSCMTWPKFRVLLPLGQFLWRIFCDIAVRYLRFDGFPVLLYSFDFADHFHAIFFFEEMAPISHRAHFVVVWAV